MYEKNTFVCLFVKRLIHQISENRDSYGAVPFYLISSSMLFVRTGIQLNPFSCHSSLIFLSVTCFLVKCPKSENLEFL